MLRMRWFRTFLLAAAGPLSLAAPAGAGLADVVEAEARCRGTVCSFRVTVLHADVNEDHHANAWDVLGPDGSVLATRVLRNPHVDEQPFTSKLKRVEVPADITRVRIRARDSIHGFGGREVEVELVRRASGGDEEDSD